MCDKSGYWVPELVWDTAPLRSRVQPSPLVPDHMNIYLRNEYTDPRLDSAFPEDLSMVAGNVMATTPQNIWIVNWQCVSPQTRLKDQTPGRYQPVIPTSCLLPEKDVCSSYPTDCYPVYLRLVVTLPECAQLSTLNPTQKMITPVATSMAPPSCTR